MIMIIMTTCYQSYWLLNGTLKRAICLLLLLLLLLLLILLLLRLLLLLLLLLMSFSRRCDPPRDERFAWVGSRQNHKAVGILP